MIFVAETEERSLIVFPNEDEAVAYCEGLDVEAAIWLFWATDGSPLEPEFITPNKRGLILVQNGTYRLVPASQDHHAELGEALEQILHMEPNPFFSSLMEIREHIARTSAGT